MSLKIFGVGNPLLLDDGVGVWVARLLIPPPDAMVFQGEIFVEDCLLSIEKGDAVIILDAVRFHAPAGTVIAIPFADCKRYCPPKAFCHEVSLLHALLYGHHQVPGYLIGIQVSQIAFHEGLSPILSEMLPDIIRRVSQAVAAILHGSDAMRAYGASSAPPISSEATRKA